MLDVKAKVFLTKLFSFSVCNADFGICLGRVRSHTCTYRSLAAHVNMLVGDAASRDHDRCVSCIARFAKVFGTCVAYLVPGMTMKLRSIRVGWLLGDLEHRSLRMHESSLNR